MWIEPGTAPCSHSSGSRTSSTTALGSASLRCWATAVVISLISDLVLDSSSLKVAIDGAPSWWTTI